MKQNKGFRGNESPTQIISFPTCVQTLVSAATDHQDQYALYENRESDHRAVPLHDKFRQGDCLLQVYTMASFKSPPIRLAVKLLYC